LKPLFPVVLHEPWTIEKAKGGSQAWGGPIREATQERKETGPACQNINECLFLRRGGEIELARNERRGDDREELHPGDKSNRRARRRGITGGKKTTCGVKEMLPRMANSKRGPLDRKEPQRVSERHAEVSKKLKGPGAMQSADARRDSGLGEKGKESGRVGRGRGGASAGDHRPS